MRIQIWEISVPSHRIQISSKINNRRSTIAPFRRYLFSEASHSDSPDIIGISGSPSFQKGLICSVVRFDLFDANLETITFWPHFDQPIFRYHFLNALWSTIRSKSRSRVVNREILSRPSCFSTKFRGYPKVNFFTLSRSERRSETSRRCDAMTVSILTLS
jgi:hypothetical protein